MVMHPAEDVVVDVAEEMDFGFDAPVVTDVFEGGVFVEHAAVPAAHLVVGYHGPVLDFLLLEHFGRFVEEVAVYPVGDCPVFFWYYFCRWRSLVWSFLQGRRGLKEGLTVVACCICFLFGHAHKFV